MNAAVEVRDLFVVYRTARGDAPALQGISLTIRAGEVVAVVGASGSGKSTLLRVAAGLETPTAGRVALLGQPVDRLSPSARARLRARHLGFVGQYAADVLPPDLSVREAVGLQARLLGTSRRGALREADGLLDDVGLGSLGRARTVDLSGGERQRAAVCAALAHRPDLVLADEPTGELDAASSRRVNAVLGRLVRERGATALVVSHDPAVAEIADRSLAIADGRLAAEEIDGRIAAVVGPGGWIRLPGDVLRDAGIGERVVLEPAGGQVRVRALGPPAARTARPRVARDPATGIGGAVVFRDVAKSYGRGRSRRTVLSGLTGCARPGQVTVVRGRSGSGKTTLLRLLAGLDRPDRGQIDIAGERISDATREGAGEIRRRKIAVVAQDAGLVDFLSAAENIALALEIRGIADSGERCGEALAMVGLAHRAGQQIGVLSAGERQRAAIARALAARPAVMLLDEPTSKLDSANAEAIADLLAEIAAHTGAIVIAASHDERILARADAVITLDAAQRHPAGQSPVRLDTGKSMR